MPSHNCIIDACDGDDYANLKLTCNECQSFVYIQCLSEEPQMQYLMQFLDITKYIAASDDKKTYYDHHKDNLNKILGGSFFKFSCHGCSSNDSQSAHIDNNNELNKNLIEHLNVKNAQIQSICQKFKEDLDNEFKEVSDSLQAVNLNSAESVISHPNVNMRRGTQSQPKINIMKNVKKNASSFEIYVAKFDLKTTTDNIVARIVESIEDIDVKMFSVQRVGGTRKYHTFASFKVTTTNYNVCESILCMNWGSQKAEMFLMKNLSPPQRDDYRNGDGKYEKNPYRNERGNEHQKRGRPEYNDNRYYRGRRPYSGNRDSRDKRDYRDRRDNRDRRDYRERDNNRNHRDKREYRERGNKSDYRDDYHRNGNVIDDFLDILHRIIPKQRNNQRR